MPSKEAVLTANAPAPLPVLSQAIKSNGMVYCSGQVGTDPKTGQMAEGTVQDRTVRQNCGESANGTDMADVREK